MDKNHFKSWGRPPFGIAGLSTTPPHLTHETLPEIRNFGHHPLRQSFRNEHKSKLKNRASGFS